MFAALSRFAIPNGMATEVREAFVKRPHLVDAVQGFLGMQVLHRLDAALYRAKASGRNRVVADVGAGVAATR